MRAAKMFLNILSITVLSVSLMMSSSAMVFDNRYFPLIQRPFFSVDGRSSHARVEPFFTTARRSYGSNEVETGLPEIFMPGGVFRLDELAKSLVLIGKPNPLRPEWRGGTFPYKVSGKIQAEGVDFAFRQQICSWFSVGANIFLMGSNSWQRFYLDRSEVTIVISDNDVLELDRIRRSMNEEIGLLCQHAAQSGIGDVDIYARFGHLWEYVCKCRSINAGIRLGALLPSGERMDINLPASVPFGGDGHYGIYGEGDAEFELKEDLKFGIFTRLSKRFARTLTRRVPAGEESYLYGVLVRPIHVDPGYTFVLSPYITLENLRGGLGFRLAYTLTKHGKDVWCDTCPNPTVPSNLDFVEKRSDWSSDYFTLNVFYDFGKVKVDRNFEPIIFLSWDVPSSVFVTAHSVKTHKVSVGIEFNY